MNDIVEFLTAKEIVVVYVVVAVAFLLCFVIYLIDKTYDKRKRKQNTRKLKRLVEDVNLRLQEGIEVPEINENVEVSEHTFIEVAPFVQNNEEVLQENVVNDFNPETVDSVQDNYNWNSNYNEMVEEEVSYNTPEVMVEEKPIYNNYNNESIEYNAYDNYSYGNSYYDNSYANNSNDVNVEELQEEATSSVEEAMNDQINKVHDKIEELVYTDPEPDREQATRELIHLAEELEKAEREQREGNTITAYENAQEENAIISLEELVKKSEEMYAANEITQYSDEGNEPISLEDLERRKQQVKGEELPVQEEIQAPIEKVEQQVVSEESHAYQGSKSFHSPIISPIYGLEKDEEELVNTADYNKLDEELQKTSEFLLSMKELQSRLNS